jgi:hypothetical protein
MTNTPRKATPVSPTRLTATFLLLFSSSALTSTAAAQAGEGPIVLRLPNSARIAAMGNAGVASSDGDALLYNPGMLSASRGAALSVQRYGSNATAGAFGSATVSGTFTYGFGVQFLDWRAMPVAYAQAVEAGASHLSDSGAIAASSTAFTVGIARTIKGLRLGVGVKYAEERFGAVHDGTVAVDLGVTRPAGPGAIGIVVQNLGAGVRFNGEKGTLPRRIGIGFGGGMFPFNEYFDLGAQMQLTVEGDDWFVRPAGGVELGYVPIEGVAIVLRTGLRLPREPDEPLVTGGLGLNVDRFSLDYAMEPFRGGRPVSHRLGVRVR